MDVESKIKEIIVEQLGVREDQVVPAARFVEDLSADSLDTIELVMKFEEVFELKISDDEVQNLQTVGDAVNYIKQAIQKAE